MYSLLKNIEFDYNFLFTNFTYHFDSSTKSDGHIDYHLVIMNPQNETSYPSKIHFSPSTGLNYPSSTSSDLLSQLLSIYNEKNRNCDDEKYNKRLIDFFNKYGYFTAYSNSSNFQSIKRTEIDSFLKLLSMITEIYSLESLSKPLESPDYNRLLELITKLVFDEFDFGNIKISNYPLSAYYYTNSYPYYYDDDRTLDYLLKKAKITYMDQVGPEEFIEKYSISDLIIYLYDHLKNQFSPIAYDILTFFYHHISEQHFTIITSDSDGTLQFEINKFDFDKYKTEIFHVADLACNFYITQACASSPLTITTVRKDNHSIRNVSFDIKQLSDALLFSLLFFDPMVHEFRECKLKGCSTRFLVKKSNQKKLFCCRSHTRTAATHRFRQS